MTTLMKVFPWLISLILLVGCSGDLKGPQGDPGQDATAKAVVSISRPSFRSKSVDDSIVIVPASDATPAKVLIADTVYTNTTSSECDITLSGRGGLDTGSATTNSVYYLYAIASESGSTFDLLASVNPPNTGPDGVTASSYLGAFITTITTKIREFVCDRGFCQLNNPMADLPFVQSTTYVSRTITPEPTTVIRHYGQLSIQCTSPGIGSARDAHISGVNLGTSSSTDDALRQRCQVNGIFNSVFGFVPALDGPNVWIHVDDPADVAVWSPYGWVEDPSQWP